MCIVAAGLSQAEARTALHAIVQKAGTTHGMIRYYFGAKEDLWKAVLDYLVNKFVISQVPVVEQMKDIDPVQLLKSYRVFRDDVPSLVGRRLPAGGVGPKPIVGNISIQGFDEPAGKLANG
jgi:AcrR family transcriptional regulator